MRIISIILFLVLGHLQLFCQQTELPKLSDKNDYKFSISTVLWTFTNFGKPETNTHHYEIRGRYYLSPKDAIGIKAATWKLFAPMGIPLWSDQLLNEESFYPGRIRESGVGFTYQRKLWKGLFTTLEVLPLFTTYIDANKTKVGNGFKLYNSYHLGYHIPLFKKGRFFIEPQLHVNHWPINSNVPQEFQVEEAKWNNYFFIEPNIYIGFKF